MNHAQRQWVAPLLAGLIAGAALTGVAAAGTGSATNCTVKAMRFVVDGADRTPAGGVLPDGNPGGFICSGRAYVPIRWLGEALGKRVGWDGSGAGATITLAGNAWTQNGVTLTVAKVQTGPQGTVVAVQARNPTGERKFVTFAVDLYDGAGHVLGTVKGPDAPVALEPETSQQLTATGAADLSGYVSVVVRPNVRLTVAETFIGQKAADVVARLGQPKQTAPRPYGSTGYQYDGLEVWVSGQGTVSSVTATPGWTGALTGGVKWGDDEATVRASLWSLGTPAVGDKDGVVLQYPAPDGSHQLLLQFHNDRLDRVQLFLPVE